jgi:NRAMP (natural resistance-associated macrophage protein)-like metal ion transporter
MGPAALMADAVPSRTPPVRPSGIRRFFSALGPGVVAGAADDDPSGIATYTIAGAQLGTSMLWTALLTWPLMATVQMMCARIGMVTGRGLTAGLRHKFPRWLVVGCAGVLLIANTINIGADLSGMADSAEVFSGLGSHYWVVPFAVLIAWATIRFHYRSIARVLKWLALVLLAYVGAALSLHPDWLAVARDTFVPRLPATPDAWGTLVAILGTTISPYLFFWQASQEVEEEKAKGQLTLARRRGASPREIRTRRMDVRVGTFCSNLVMFFIILTSALTLHRAGVTKLETSRQAALALQPLAGNLAAGLYAAGLIGVGLLAIPTLAGSAAYSLAETFGWKQGLDESFRSAPRFYVVVVLAMLGGIGLDFTHVSPLRALYWSAVLNGLLAPLLLVGILAVAVDEKLMKGQPSSWLSRITVGCATLLMLGAGVAMFAL